MGSDVAYPSKGKETAPDKYDIERWTNTVVEAMEILNDKKKMKHIKACLDNKKAALMSLEDVKKRVSEESE